MSSWLQVGWKVATLENNSAPGLFQEEKSALIIWKINYV